LWEWLPATIISRKDAAPTKKEINFFGDNMGIFTNPEESAVKDLLSASGLPIADISAQHLHHFFGFASGGKLLGIVGLELYDEVALLRSLAVASSRRGAGLGSDLVEHAERYARDHGVKFLYLLTNTAESFFIRRGYARVLREKAPEAIRNTKEFDGICPLNSAFMVKRLWSQPL
jgi:amino-acid N-acetyltransferase